MSFNAFCNYTTITKTFPLWIKLWKSYKIKRTIATDSMPKNVHVFYYILLASTIISVASFLFLPDKKSRILHEIIGEFSQIEFKSLSASLSQNTELIIENAVLQENQEQNNLSEEDLTDFSQAESLQDQLDDIQEKLDIISRQVQELILAQQNQTDKTPEPEENPTADEQVRDNNQINTDRQSPVVAIAGGGGGYVSYQKIMISEVQTASASDSKAEFVELYNPNSQDVDLTGWYLQRKTAGASSWATYASNNLFSGKKISANNYFLIARTGYFAGLADIYTDNPITDDNSLALKNPNGEISDKLGFGNAKDPESEPTINPQAGQSIGRKNLENSEQDTDNNLNDFEIQIPTPKAHNATYIEPVPPAPSDTTPPQIIFDIDPAQTSLSFPVKFTITDLAETVSPSGIKSYIFRWQEESKDWQADGSVDVDGNPTSSDFSRNFTGEDGKTYNFQVRATDANGNTSSWLPQTSATTTVKLILKILIDEVQIDPIGQRFIELYNPNSQGVDLTGWYLQRKIKTSTSWSSLVSSTNFKDKTIAAGEYFIISRELENSDILLDITLSDDNSLVLKNSDGSIVDKVGYGSAQDFELSPASNPQAGQSLQRKWDASAATAQDTNDNSADFELDSPTPKAQNFVHLSNDATITSGVYQVSSLTDNAGTISGILPNTAKADFENNIVLAPGATMDDSAIEDPVETGNVLIVIAQDGTTKSVYTVTVSDY